MVLPNVRQEQSPLVSGMANMGLQADSVAEMFGDAKRTSSSAVEQPVYTGSVGSSILSSPTIPNPCLGLTTGLFN